MDFASKPCLRAFPKHAGQQVIHHFSRALPNRSGDGTACLARGWFTIRLCFLRNSH